MPFPLITPRGLLNSRRDPSAPPPPPPVVEGREPAAGSAEALQVLAAQGLAGRDPRLEPEALTRSIQRLLRLRVWLEQLNDEHRQILEQLRVAHLRGDLLRLLAPTADGKGYVIAPTTALVRRSGRKQWRYSSTVQELDCQLRARQDYEQRSGTATYALGSGFWELKAIKECPTTQA